MLDLYHKNRANAEDSGLALLPKLKFEHVHLTSFSKMRVDLAAQVCTFMYMHTGTYMHVYTTCRCIEHNIMS